MLLRLMMYVGDLLRARPGVLRIPACEVGPWLASGNLDLRTVSTVMPLCLNCLCRQSWFMLNTCLHSGRIGYMPGTRCLCD